MNLRSDLVANNDGLRLDIKLWNRNINGVIGLAPNHMHPALNHIWLSLTQVQIVLIDKRFRNVGQRNLPRQPAVVEPIGLRRRYPIFMASVIHRSNDEVSPRLQRRRNIAIESSEPTLMLANPRTIHPEDRLVIRRAHMQENPHMRLQLIREILLVPHQAFVPEELRLL